MVLGEKVVSMECLAGYSTRDQPVASWRWKLNYIYLAGCNVKTFTPYLVPRVLLGLSFEHAFS